ncbi:MAG: hypothetical protein AB1411_03045 [Nitrospirota bacterium]
MKTRPKIVRRAVPPRCDRCGGLLVFEWIGELNGDDGTWRCVICGERIDPVVVAHRREMAAHEPRR